LDEPTNHLDIHSTELLVEAMNRYQGSFVLVSHDRYFIAKTANKIWEIVDNEIKEFKGTYDEWIEWNERMAKQKAENNNGKPENARNEKKNTKPEKEVPVVIEPVINTPINKEAKKELQKQQRLFQKVEEQLAALNAQKTQLEAKLGSPEAYSDKQVFADTEKQYKAVQAQLAELNTTYEQVFEKLMELESENG
jgi:ATP-binding cassette subfamily F protein 3